MKEAFIPDHWMGTREAAEHLLGCSKHHRPKRVIYNMQKQIDAALRFYRDNQRDPDRHHVGIKGEQTPTGRWTVRKEHLEAWAIRRNIPGWCPLTGGPKGQVGQLVGRP